MNPEIYVRKLTLHNMVTTDEGKSEVDNADAVDDTSVLVFSEGAHLSKLYLS